MVESRQGAVSRQQTERGRASKEHLLGEGVKCRSSFIKFGYPDFDNLVPTYPHIQFSTHVF